MLHGNYFSVQGVEPVLLPVAAEWIHLQPPSLFYFCAAQDCPATTNRGKHIFRAAAASGTV